MIFTTVVVMVFLYDERYGIAFIEHMYLGWLIKAFGKFEILD